MRPCPPRCAPRQTAHIRDIVAPEVDDCRAIGWACQGLSEWFEQRAFPMATGHRKVVALLEERDEIQPERPRRGEDAQADRGCTAQHVGSDRHVRIFLALIACDPRRLDAMLLQMIIEQDTRARSLLPIDESYVRPGQIVQ